MAFKFGTSDISYDMNVQGNNKDVKMQIDGNTLKSSTDNAVQAVMKSAGKSASKIIEGGADIITAPPVWLKDMQQNWLIYMIVAAVIISSIAFLYCAVCSYLNRKKNNLSNNKLAELAKIISNKNGILQQPLSLSAVNLASLPPNLMV
jgi:hypothetical protein